MKTRIAEKISLLNETILQAVREEEIVEIVKLFTDVGLRTLGASFGFAWWQTANEKNYDLIYRTSGTPYEPRLPRPQGGNFEARRTKKPFFVETVHTEDYPKGYDVSPYMMSYVIIPICHKENIYGNIVLCYKKSRRFDAIDRELCAALGTATAQSITIHRLKKSEQRAAVADLAQKAHVKDAALRTEFIANAAHEIRTPLSIIRGHADLALMHGTGLPPAAAKAFRAINSEIDHLSRLVADLSILTITKEDESLATTGEEIDLRKLLTALIKRCRTIAEKKKLKFTSNQMPQVFVRGRFSNLERLFLNLIKNGINYNKPGGTLKLVMTATDGEVEVKITDTGIGISSSDLPHVFNRFYRADKSHNSKTVGSGLGLAIVKQIAREHSGEVTVTSKLGQGSEFIVTLPRLKKD